MACGVSLSKRISQESLGGVAETNGQTSAAQTMRGCFSDKLHIHGGQQGCLLTTHLGTQSSESSHLERCLQLCRGERRGELGGASRWSLNSQPRSDTCSFHSKCIVQRVSCGPPCTDGWGRSEILPCTWERAIWRHLGE